MSLPPALLIAGGQLMKANMLCGFVGVLIVLWTGSVMA